MATTTPNYGWTVPTSTDLVKDGATAIETLGDSVDATVKALNPETTLGDIAYRSATANTNTRLAIGTSGQVLSVSSGVPAWVTAGSGAVAKVVSATTVSTTTTTSASFVDTALTATITPTSASNKILIFGVLPVGYYGSGLGYYGIGIRILRGSTNINTSEPGEAFSIQSTSLGSNFSQFSRQHFNYTDSPATTSATTYKIQISSNNGTSLANYHDVGSIILMEVTP